MAQPDSLLSLPQSDPDLLDALSRLSKLAESLDISQLVYEILGVLLDATPMDVGAIYLLSEHNYVLQRTAVRSQPAAGETDLDLAVLEAQGVDFPLQHPVGSGLAGGAFDKGQPIYIYPQSANPAGLVGSAALRACIPLVAGGEPMGVVDLWASAAPISPAFHARLEILTRYAAALILAARSSVHAQNATSQLIVFYVFGSRILGAKTLQQALDLTLRFIMEATPAHSAAIYLYDASETLVLHLGMNRKGQPMSDVPLPTADKLTRRIQASGRPVSVSGLEANASELIPGFLRDAGVQAYVSLPLHCGNAPFSGAMYVHYATPHNFTSMELEGLRLFGDQVSNIIEHLHVLDQSRQRQADLEAVIDTTHILTSTLNSAELLQQIAVRLIWVTNVDACEIIAYDPGNRRLNVLARYNSFGAPESTQVETLHAIEEYPAFYGVLRTGEHLVLRSEDTLTESGEVQLLKRLGFTSALLFPLTALGRPSGLVALYSRETGHQFTSTTLRRLRLLAEQLALTLINTKLYAEEQRVRLLAETLREATAALNATLELNQVLDLILKHLQQVLRLDSASVLLLENDGFYVVAVHNHPHPEKALSLRGRVLEDELIARIVLNKETVILADASQDPRFRQLGQAKYVRGWMGIPLVERGEVIGMLTIDSTSANAYTEEDAQLGLAFANQAAVAVTNARLYQSEHRQRTLSEALREVSLALSGTLKASAILETLIDQIKNVVPYNTACVFLVEGEIARATSHRGFERYEMAPQIETLRLRYNDLPNLRDMMHSGRAQYIADVSQDPRWTRLEGYPQIGSWAGAPLIARDRLLGFLSLDQPEPGFYQAEHARNLEILSAHASLALLNAITFSEVELASVTDFLTGTFNHRYFHQRLREEIDRAKRMDYPLSLLMIDLDFFKRVNDTYGHPIGDVVLKTLAWRIKKEMRDSDLLARYGGEEFTVILPGTPESSLAHVAERLRRAVADEPFSADEHSIPMTISLGGATFPNHANDAKDLVTLADQALYRSKSGGRNRFHMAAPDKS